ncbi:MAG: hypothetical protein ACOYB2_18840 [Limnohabitans sp.]
MTTLLVHRTDANQRPRGRCRVTLEWHRNTIISLNHMDRRYLPTGKTAIRSTGEAVIEMMARDYFLERLWLKTDGKALWEQQPIAL